MRKLNLGCGNDFIEDAVNHDLTIFDPQVNVAHDLNLLPWPWENEQFEEVIAKSVLEHLDHNLIVSMNEIWRIIKFDGLVTLKLPHWRSDVSHWDPTHRWYFSLMSFDQLDPTTKRGMNYVHYTPYKWEIVTRPFLTKSQSSIYTVMRKIEWNGIEPGQIPEISKDK